MLWNIRKLVRRNTGYVLAVVPEHPNCDKHGYVLANRVRLENKIGRLLRDDEIAHHKDENRRNNAEDNLEVMDKCRHSSMHSKSRGRVVCKFKCPQCAIAFERDRRDSHLIKPSNLKMTFCSIKCSSKFSTNLQHKKISKKEVASKRKKNIMRMFRLIPNEHNEKYSRTNLPISSKRIPFEKKKVVIKTNKEDLKLFLSPKEYKCKCGKNIDRKAKECRPCSIISRSKAINKCTCNEEINNNAKECVSCSIISRRKVSERPKYKDLIREIKNSNYCAVGRKYGVSDNAIRKWVKQYEKK